MMAFGGSDTLQGLTMAKDAYNGIASDGNNPGRNLAVKINPRWGNLGYDVLSGIATGAGAIGKVPLVVDPGVTGISTTKSLFGVQVPQIDNSVSIVGKVLDSNAKRAILAGSVCMKAGAAYQDYPRN